MGYTPERREKKCDNLPSLLDRNFRDFDRARNQDIVLIFVSFDRTKPVFTFAPKIMLRAAASAFVGLSYSSDVRLFA